MLKDTECYEVVETQELKRNNFKSFKKGRPEKLYPVLRGERKSLGSMILPVINVSSSESLIDSWKFA